MQYQNSLEFARQMDQTDPLRRFRDRFVFPQHKGRNVAYFTGNSLGLQPKDAKQAVEEVLTDWGQLAVEGHFYADRPWFDFHKLFKKNAASLAGCEEEEVVLMNALTVNLHFLMVSFYRPQGKRFKILCEEKAFPSDQYVLESQVKFHGYDPQEAIVEVGPRPGEHLIREEDVLQKIDELGDTLALVMMGGVNYYTGQLFDMQRITAHAQSQGALVGWDLAHAYGNVELKLAEWNVDFAAWCTYKYLNSGPGACSGVFVNKRYADDRSLPRFAGWWGYDQATRFKMEKGFVPMHGADGWQVSNGPILGKAAHRVALDLFAEAGFDNCQKKRDLLTGYLEFVLDEISAESTRVKFEIITPRDKTKRGSQLSVLVHGQGRELFTHLMENGVVVDWREPGVIRMAPVPLYNSFEDIYIAGQHIREKCVDHS
ncbi:MAG TPA: kynureninase [Luteibaculaceae bacterium]|nr:kynureninase [Luteibaculaceae bacterium]